MLFLNRCSLIFVISTLCQIPFVLIAKESVSENGKILSCQVAGGLGNQLFQIANALAMAWDYGYEPIFPMISYAESRVAPRPVYWDSIFHKIQTYTCEESYLDLVPCYEESCLYYKKIYPSEDRVKLIGYFPSHRYFDHHREKIWAMFELPPEWDAIVEERFREIKINEADVTVSIHIRLDDTFLEPVHGVIDFWRKPYDSYYDQAISLFPADVILVIFSDNCAWSREYMKDKLQGRRAVYVCDQDFLDINLMARCDHNIIVNSTYSWWGAYLNQNPDKIVVAPKYWQARGNHPFRPDIHMPNWTLIDNCY